MFATFGSADKYNTYKPLHEFIFSFLLFAYQLNKEPSESFSLGLQHRLKQTVSVT